MYFAATALVLAAEWMTNVGLFLALLGALLCWLLLRAIATWRKLARAGTPLHFGAYMRLRWSGADVAAIAAAHWTARSLGLTIPLEAWVSFALVGVDVVNLAAALGATAKSNVEATFGQLGAIALAGYDPVEFVRAAQRHSVTKVTGEVLAQLDSWGLSRSKKRS